MKQNHEYLFEKNHTNSSIYKLEKIQRIHDHVSLNSRKSMNSLTKKYALTATMLCNIKNPRKVNTPSEILDFICKYNFPIILIHVC